MQMKSGFWAFSLRLYSSKAVRNACLRLQNDIDADVNLLLFCCWHASEYGQINDKLFAATITFSEQWRNQVISPLREARQWMKHYAFDIPRIDHSNCQLREDIKVKELEAEHIQQTFLEALTLEFTNENHEFILQDKPAQASINNVKHYLKHAGITIQTELHLNCRKNVATIIGAAFHLSTDDLILDNLFIHD